MKSCPSSEIDLPDKGTGCGHFIKVVMWTLLGIFGFIRLIYLIFAIALNVAQEEAYGSKAKAPNKGFDRSEWATTVATFPTPIPNKE